MKKIFMILFLLICTFVVFATGSNEKTITLTWVSTGSSPFPDWIDSKGFAGAKEMMAAKFEEEHPGVKVNLIYRDVTQGSLTVDAMMAKGDIPDVWQDAQGYFIKYFKDRNGLPFKPMPLDKYVDTSIFYDHLVAPFIFDGNVYALPQNNVAGGLAINLDLLDKIGYKMPDQKDWTTDEFLRLSAKLKAAGIPATMMITQNGMNSWIWPWVYAFGGELYKNQDHSKVTINTPEAVKGFNYMKKLVDLGYTWPYPNEINQDKAVELFCSGQVFSSMMQNGHTDYWIPQMVQQGVIDKEINLTFVEIPHEPGRKHTKTFGYQTIVVAHKTDNEERNKLVAELAMVAAGEESQYYTCVVGGGFPTIKGYDPRGGNADKASRVAIDKVRIEAGQMDLGSLEPRSEEINRLWIPLVQAFMDGKITAEEMLDSFEKDAMKIINE